MNLPRFINKWLASYNWRLLNKIITNQRGTMIQYGYDDYLQGHAWGVAASDESLIAIVVDRGYNKWYIIPNPRQSPIATAYAASMITLGLRWVAEFSMLSHWDVKWDRQPGKLLVLPNNGGLH